MSEDEVLATIASVIVTLVVWVYWYAQLAAIRYWLPNAPSRKPLAFLPLVCAGAMLLVLTTIASADVVNDPRYIFMYLVMGMACVGIAVSMGSLLGIGYRTDALERANPAARTATAGLLVGTTACYAGGNVGNGPGWWVVVFCAGLANGSLLLGWLIFQLSTRVNESITIERSRASGMRLAGFLTGAGLILGRSVAGDWVSAQATVDDFAGIDWPILLLIALAIVLEIVYRPAPGKPEQEPVHAGWVPMIAYTGFGLCHILLYGMPDGGVG